MSSHLNNALREHEPEDGMLMAIEDFLRASHYELDLLELPGIHGLGILTPTSLKRQNPDLAQLLGKLDFSPTVVRYVQGSRGPGWSWRCANKRKAESTCVTYRSSREPGWRNAENTGKGWRKRAVNSEKSGKD